MKIRYLEEIDEHEYRLLMNRATGEILDPKNIESIRQIVEDVREHGDKALLEYTRKFHQLDIKASSLKVSEEEFEEARKQVKGEVVDAINMFITHTTRYNQMLMPRSIWLEELDDGVLVGERCVPIEKVGLYIPSGKGSYPSTVVTMATPAVVAGVKEIYLFVAPKRNGSLEVDPAVLVAAEMLGVKGVYRGAGVAGIAAFAFGTETIPRVYKVVGPGNPYITAAQLYIQLYGVPITLLLGPTECMVLADDSADPERVALDLLTEAEHGKDSASLLVTPSEELAREVGKHLDSFLTKLPDWRREFASAVFSGYGGAVITKTLDEAIAFVNDYAPEHLQVATRAPLELLTKIEHAGEILLGQHTPFSGGNYAIGVPAGLPTGQTAKVNSGITVHTFLKRSSVAYLQERGLRKVKKTIEALGDHEEFYAHALSVRARRFEES
ncbi:MAG: histidinol dehydrogenase [Candidatus Tectomicrobia bacterium]|nr:histidinol dehydrogenase [Candidatus Tectomicrobia bacterium]